MRTTLWTQLHEALIEEFGITTPTKCSGKVAEVICEAVALIEQLRAERDALQAQLDKVREPLSSVEIDKSYDFSGGTTRYSLASGIHRAIVDRLEE